MEGEIQGIGFDSAGYLPSSLGPAALNSELDEPSASQRAPPQDVGPLGNGRGSPSEGSLMPISKPKKQIKVGRRRLAPDIYTEIRHTFVPVGTEITQIRNTSLWCLQNWLATQ